jgi:hypothetical protein
MKQRLLVEFTFPDNFGKVKIKPEDLQDFLISKTASEFLSLEVKSTGLAGIVSEINVTEVD